MLSIAIVIATWGRLVANDNNTDDDVDVPLRLPEGYNLRRQNRKATCIASFHTH